MSRSKVLLVDDDVDFLSSMKSGLDVSFDTTVTPVPEQAITLCKNDRWDAVIIDIAMPVINGLELFQRLKPMRPDACYMFLSCLTDDAIYCKSLSLDPDGFISKPVTPHRLSAAISHRLRRKQTTGALLVQDGLQVNLEKGCLFIENQKIELTKKEERILVALLKSPELKMHREELEREVWGDVSVSRNTLDTHLSNLRRKISDARFNIYVDDNRCVILIKG